MICSHHFWSYGRSPDWKVLRRKSLFYVEVKKGAGLGREEDGQGSYIPRTVEITANCCN